MHCTSGRASHEVVDGKRYTYSTASVTRSSPWLASASDCPPTKAAASTTYPSRRPILSPTRWSSLWNRPIFIGPSQVRHASSEALYVLAVHTGMREGELLGLKWEDVDLERGVLRLTHALVREGGKTALGDLKTAPRVAGVSGSPAQPQTP